MSKSQTNSNSSVGAMMEQDQEEDEISSSNSIRSYLHPLLPQMLVGFIDAVSFMIIAPSLVFYVLQSGGTKEQYGIILAMFSFSSFLFKPVLAYWSDSIRRFRPPYLTSIVVAGVGGLVYFVASCFHGTTAVALILVGRFLGGCGAANTTLGYTYVAHVIPKEHFTQANALLSMVRVAGMAIAPALNAAVASFQVELMLGSYRLSIDPLNSVGLLLAFGNALGYISVYFWFEEPADMVKPSSELNAPGQERGWRFWRNLGRFDILVPLLSILVLNANYQLLETGLAPAAHDILGWDPVRISALFGVNAVVIFVVIMLTFTLAGRGVSDLALMKVGLALSIVGYSLMYLWWHRLAPMWMFVTPGESIDSSVPHEPCNTVRIVFTSFAHHLPVGYSVIVSCTVFPFLSSPTRSLFTRAVANHPTLRHSQGTMQAMLSMNVSVAGFVAPGLIAAYVLRSPEQVTASADQREFTPWALFAPVLSAVILAGVLYIQCQEPAEAKALEAQPLATDQLNRYNAEEEDLEEDLALLTGLYQPEADAKLLEATRRNTILLMGIPTISFHGGVSPTSRKLSRHSSAF